MKNIKCNIKAVLHTCRQLFRKDNFHPNRFHKSGSYSFALKPSLLENPLECLCSKQPGIKNINLAEGNHIRHGLRFIAIFRREISTVAPSLDLHTCSTISLVWAGFPLSKGRLYHGKHVTCPHISWPPWVSHEDSLFTCSRFLKCISKPSDFWSVTI